MKIVNICMNAPFTEGYSYQDNLLSEYQAKLGHSVTIITSTRTRGENGKEVQVDASEKVLSNGVHLVRIKTGNKLKSFLGYYPSIYAILKRLEPDIVFVHGLCSFVTSTAIKYKKSCKNKTVYILADNHQDEGTTKTQGFPFQQQLFLLKLLWKKWINNVEKVYGTTSWRTTFARKVYGIPNEKLDTLIMGIDSEKLPSDCEKVRNEIRMKLNVSSKSFMFISGGKLDSRKKVLEMMEAFHRVKNDDAVFLLFGSVSEEIKTQFDKYVHEDNRFKYIGYLHSNQIKKYFIAADFALFAGRHSVLWEEAIGCGLPCLFKKYEDLDHVEVCDNCISIRYPTVEKISEVIELVMRDPSYYNSLKEASVKASETFSYWEIAKKSLECYR